MARAARWLAGCSSPQRPAEVDDPAIVEFTAARDDGSAQFNPGLTATAVGSTGVTLDNGETGDTVSFTVEVTPATSGY